jgi:hypothetical protein
MPFSHPEYRAPSKTANLGPEGHRLTEIIFSHADRHQSLLCLLRPVAARSILRSIAVRLMVC